MRQEETRSAKRKMRLIWAILLALAGMVAL